MGKAVRWTPEQLDAYTRRLAGMVSAAPIQIAPLAPKACRSARARSALEIEMERQLREADIAFVAEFKPLENRRFRIDFALPDHMIGVECEGEVHRIKGRWAAFPERHHLLSQAGWRIIYAGRTQIMNGQALAWVRECMGRRNGRRMARNSEVRGASRNGEASSAKGATSTVVLGAVRPGKE